MLQRVNVNVLPKKSEKKYPAEEFENMMENIIRTGKIPESYWAAGREAAVKCILE